MKSSMFGLGLSFSGNLATEVSLKRELTLKDSVRASKKLLAKCKRTQQLPTFLGVVSQQCCVRLHGA